MYCCKRTLVKGEATHCGEGINLDAQRQRQRHSIQGGNLRQRAPLQKALAVLREGGQAHLRCHLHPALHGNVANLQSSTASSLCRTLDLKPYEIMSHSGSACRDGAAVPFQTLWMIRCGGFSPILFSYEEVCLLLHMQKVHACPLQAQRKQVHLIVGGRSLQHVRWARTAPMLQ